MAEKVSRDLEFDEALDSHRREWRIKRAAWIVFTLVLLAALAGGFGGGALANKRAQSAESGLEIEYESLLRSRRPSELNVRASHPDSGTVALKISREFSRSCIVERVVPEPEKVVTEPGFLVYHFAAGAGAAEIKFEFEPIQFGSIEFTLAQPDRAPLPIKVFVYP